MRFALPFMLILTLSTSLWADGVTELQASLQRLQGHTLVKAEVACTLHQEHRTLLTPVVQEHAWQLQVGEDEAGLHVDWNRPSHDLATPEALRGLDAVALDDLLNQGAGLSHLIASATFAGESRDAYLGKEVRVLTFTCKPRVLTQHQGRVTQAGSTLKVWVGDDGAPLATEFLVDYNGRYSRLYGRIQSHSLVKTTYAVMGHRLVVASRISEEDLYDYGDLLKRRRTLTLTQRG